MLERNQIWFNKHGFNFLFLQKRVHGRIYCGIYSVEKICKGTMITIPFRFPGKNFKSTAKCFCTQREKCYM